MAKRDYYDILGLPKNATEDDIKKAYRKLAMKHHPDRNQGDGAKASEEKFKEAKEAYEILSEPQKRAAYDQFGHQGVAKRSTAFSSKLSRLAPRLAEAGLSFFSRSFISRTQEANYLTCYAILMPPKCSQKVNSHRI